MVELVETLPPLVELVETTHSPVATLPIGPAPLHPSRMPYVYILECGDLSFYVGSTWDLERRIAQHNSGEGAMYTKRRRPVRLVHVEEFARIDEEFAREKQVQGWGRAKRLALIEGRLSELPGLSASRKSDG